jgi:hypothetical protein
MKASLVSAAVAAMAGVVSAGHGHAHRHAHELLAKRAAEVNACGLCTTTVSTYYGQPTCKIAPLVTVGK